MTNKIRYGDYFREVSVERNVISYNDLVPALQQDSEGNPLPYRAPKIQLRAFDVYRIIMPYTQVRIAEQMKAVLPLALYLVFFQILILRQSVEESSTIAAGLVAVILGLMLFMEGLKVGLMPLGETLGSSLPVKSTLPVVLFITCLLGIGVTYAEPAIGALKTAGQIVDVTQAPYLYTLLNEKLMHEKGINTGNINNSRGVGHISFQGSLRVGDESEREILSVVVTADQAEEIFEYIHDLVEVDRPHGGIIYQHALHQSSEFVLPNIPEEDKPVE